MARQPNYEPRPEIARLKSFNAQEGFNSYHIKWAIGKLPVNPIDGCVNSGYFDTNVSKYSENRDQSYQLRLFIIGDEYDTMSITLLRRFDQGEDHEIPLIARVKLLNETNGISEFSSAAFLLARNDYWYDWELPDNDAKGLSKTDRYAVHCWLDIPKKYDGTYSTRSIPNGTALLSSSLGLKFDKVMIKNGDLTSDIELVIKDGTDDPPRFYCHRLILAARSPVFETMFTNDRFKENNERIVEIEDMDGETLKLLLEYLYTGKITRKLCDTPNELIKPLLNAAEKYMLPELKDECVLALIGSGKVACDDGEWIEYLHRAESFNLEYLKKVCMLVLSTNMRSLSEEDIRGLGSNRSMLDLLEVVTKRGEISQTIEVKTDSSD